MTAEPTAHPSAPITSPIEDVLLPVVSNVAVLVGGRLGVFTALADGPLTAAELATRLGLTEPGVDVLAKLLVARGWLIADRAGYANGEPATRWVLPGSEIDFGSTLIWGFRFLDFLVELPETIRTGKPSSLIWERFVADPGSGAVFSEFMEAKSKLTIDDIVATVPVEDTDRRLLDLGGSHGLHTTGLCHRHSALDAVIMDLPASLTHTPGRIEAAGLTSRVTIRPGSYLIDDVGDGEFDVALCFELLHCHVEDECLVLLERIHRALRPGGRIAILEEVPRGLGDEQNAAFGLAMFAQLAARTYTEQEMTGWLSRVGFADPVLTRLPSGTVSLLVARRA